MADIRIEKKRRIWPWILLIIILGILAFLYIYGSLGTEETDDMEEVEMEEVTLVKPPIELNDSEVKIS
ncbi:hypothetical protein [Gramella sp. MAR_2010_147]|uniref:hypothetical protein n=1 Tax=Gramella sp. MAR_2010_147 TaxID=1250205 RepID=UPI0008796AA1|nr:hypothetical protein [Gramella sp. MAR_2010_147]SDR87616.1 hypothetical protein SAMN04488553_0921 [Gramella sp. MAR_2010_147]